MPQKRARSSSGAGESLRFVAEVGSVLAVWSPVFAPQHCSWKFPRKHSMIPWTLIDYLGLKKLTERGRSR